MPSRLPAGGASFSFSPVGTAVVRNSRSPQTIGDDRPSPGTAFFQRTFFVSDHSTGGLPAGADPVRLGPRQAGQPPSTSEAGSGAGIAAAMPASRPATATAAAIAGERKRSVVRAMCLSSLGRQESET